MICTDCNKQGEPFNDGIFIGELCPSCFKVLSHTKIKNGLVKVKRQTDKKQQENNLSQNLVNLFKAYKLPNLNLDR